MPSARSPILLLLALTTSASPACEYRGKEYEEGASVWTGEPCVGCECRAGAGLVCRLRVCPPLPRPPPPPCFLLHRRGHCCETLVCPHDIDGVEGRAKLEAKSTVPNSAIHNEGCVLNGTMYGEGSAMVTSTLCEYCYCIKGKQHCVRPQCVLSVSGCEPVYNKHSCCPTKYNCSNVSNTTTTSTTSMPSSSATSMTGCNLNGTYYPEGERVDFLGNQCENCYCMKGKVRCEPVVCQVPLNKPCTPVHSKGHCCPTSYNCTAVPDSFGKSTTEMKISPSEKSTTMMATYEVEDKPYSLNAKIESSTETTTTMLQDSTFMPANETTENDFTSTTETVFTTTDVIPTTNTAFNDSELRSGIHNDLLEEESTVFSTTEVTETSESLVTTTQPDNKTDPTSTTVPERAISSEIEAILNRTREKDEDYGEYDYNEPSLPPSLPNLRIIPFVAADAVVSDPEDSLYKPKQETASATENPLFYDVSNTNRFSPPAETEGGFMPRDPTIDGPFYESKYDPSYSTIRSGIPLEITSETMLPPITETLKHYDSDNIHEKCMYGEGIYAHGEVVTEPNACEVCICYYGEIHCQEPKCSPLGSGCHRVRDVPGSCCGRIVCPNDSNIPTRVIDRSDIATTSILEHDKLSHLPAITVADDIITPDPFRDVIKTEPAPDLGHLIGEIMPFLYKTTTPKSMPHTTLLNSLLLGISKDISKVTKTSTSNPDELTYASVNTSSINLTGNKTIPTRQTQLNLLESATKENIYKSELSETPGSGILYEVDSPSTFTNPNKGQDKTQDYDDENGFSFASVFDMLFSNGEISGNKINSSPKYSGVNKNQTSPSNSSDNIFAPLNSNSNETENLNCNNSFFKINCSTDDQFSNGKVERPGENLAWNHENLKESNIDKQNSQQPKRPLGTTKPFFTTMKSPILTTESATGYFPPISVPDPGAASGLLKLAGCNIYGRMYRVGRIITELSGPCLECMCTEVGVQCRQLPC